jgi:hypothetical protein
MSHTLRVGGGAHSGVRARREQNAMTSRGDLRPTSPERMIGRRWAEVVATPTLAARKLGADFPIFEQRMHEKALSSAVRARLAIGDFAGPGVRR